MMEYNEANEAFGDAGPDKIGPEPFAVGMGQPRLVWIAWSTTQGKPHAMLPWLDRRGLTLNGSITMLPCNAIWMRKWGRDEHAARVELVLAVLALGLISTEFLTRGSGIRSKAPK